MVLLDAVWAVYIRSTADRKAGLASFCSAIIVVCGAFATLNFVDDPRLVLPAALGAAIGTFLGVRRVDHQ